MTKVNFDTGPDIFKVIEKEDGHLKTKAVVRTRKELGMWLVWQAEMCDRPELAYELASRVRGGDSLTRIKSMFENATGRSIEFDRLGTMELRFAD